MLSLKGTRNIFFVVALVLVDGDFARAQATKAQKSVPSIVGVRPNTPPFPQFRATPVLQNLVKNQRNFAASPPYSLASELAAATLPAAARKLYSLPGLSKADFLASHALEPNHIHARIHPELDLQQIFGARLPRIDGTR